MNWKKYSKGQYNLNLVTHFDIVDDEDGWTVFVNFSQGKYESLESFESIKEADEYIEALLT